MTDIVNLEHISKFEDYIKIIYNYTTKYGLDHAKPPKIDDRESIELFIKECHKGYALAQDLIVKKLLELENEQNKAKNFSKGAHQEKNKQKTIELSKQISDVNYRIAILKKLADTIGWILINDQKYIARRLFFGKPPIVLSESNLSSVIDVANNFNNTNYLSFALISDITSFIQVGDLLVNDLTHGNEKRMIVEVKEGKINDKAFDFLDSFSKTLCPRALYFFEKEYGEKALEQVERIAKQGVKGLQVQEIINNGYGKDPATNMDIEIPEEKIELEFYDDYLIEAIKSCREKGWFYGTLDRCLWIGVYNRGIYPIPSIVFKMACFADIYSEQNSEIPDDINKLLPFPVHDLRSGFYDPLANPIFLRQLPDGDKFDITMGRIIVLLYFDYDAMFNLAKEYGLDGRWSTKKEAANVSHDIKKYLIKNKNKLALVEINGKNSFIGEGVISRILFDGITTKSAFSFFLWNKNLAPKERDKIPYNQ